MEDTDLIAYMYPHTNVNEYASKAIETSSRYAPPRLQSPRARYGRRDRESTEPPEQTDIPAYHYLPRLEVRLSDIPRTSYGILFGSDPNSDVVLPAFSGVSYHHFTLTFDDAKRLIVRDWGSLVGTEVTYDGQGHGKRRNFRWIVGGHDIPQGKKSIIITVHETISFQIVIARHDITSQAYIDKVDRFCRGMATAEDLLDNLNFPGRGTERPTGVNTPGTGAIHLRKKLGQGSFGVVTHFWNVSDGSEYALKEPTAQAIRKRQVDYNAWQKEARIMSQLAYPHIVKLLQMESTAPYPQLHLEYLPSGSLEDQENISAQETLSILRQCLSALAYLHGHEPPIVHRDIKPGNILVQCRYLDYIHVKFGDFGLSRASYDLSTICGSYKYLAPEIYEKQGYVNSGGSERISYSAAVDIWSLGVVVYELVCCLPRYKAWYQGGGTGWCEEVVDKLKRDLEERPDELKRFLSRALVVISPDLRGSAQDCYDRAMLLPSATDDRYETPTSTCHANRVEQTSFRYRARDHVADGQKTVLWNDSAPMGAASANDSSNANDEEQPTVRGENHIAHGGSAEVAPAGKWSSFSAGDRSAFSIEPSRRVRSDAPSPRSHVSASGSAQKRPPAESTSSSSPCRRHSKRRDRRSGYIEPISPQQLEASYPSSNGKGPMRPRTLRSGGQHCTAWTSHSQVRSQPGCEETFTEGSYHLDVPDWAPGEEADDPLVDNTRDPPHSQAWINDEKDLAKSSQLDGPLQVCPVDGQAGHDSLDQETAEAANLLQLLGHDPRTPPNVDAQFRHIADNSYSGDNSSCAKGPRSFKKSLPGLDSSERAGSPDNYSQFTEASYENGSYLAPTNRSYLQLLN